MELDLTTITTKTVKALNDEDLLEAWDLATEEAEETDDWDLVALIEAEVELRELN